MRTRILTIGMLLPRMCLGPEIDRWIRCKAFLGTPVSPACLQGCIPQAMEIADACLSYLRRDERHAQHLASGVQRRLELQWPVCQTQLGLLLLL